MTLHTEFLSFHYSITLAPFLRPSVMFVSSLATREVKVTACQTDFAVVWENNYLIGNQKAQGFGSRRVYYCFCEDSTCNEGPLGSGQQTLLGSSWNLPTRLRTAKVRKEMLLLPSCRMLLSSNRDLTFLLRLIHWV